MDAKSTRAVERSRAETSRGYQSSRRGVCVPVASGLLLPLDSGGDGGTTGQTLQSRSTRWRSTEVGVGREETFADAGGGEHLTAKLRVMDADCQQANSRYFAHV
jgi:hypothetical protein